MVEKIIKVLDRLKKYFISILLSILVSGVFLKLSFSINDLIAQNFLISLSASVLAIGVAIIIVDYTRDRWFEGQYKIPRTAAINKIIGMHSSLALLLAIKNKKNNESLLVDLACSTQLDKNSTKINSDAAQRIINKLSKIKTSDILNDFSRKELTSTLKTTLEFLNKDYTNINNLYLYSFNDIKMQSAYTELQESLNTLLNSFAMIELLKDSEYETMFCPINPDKYGTEKMTANLLIAIELLAYLKKYSDFINLYKK